MLTVSTYSPGTRRLPGSPGTHGLGSTRRSPLVSPDLQNSSRFARRTPKRVPSASSVNQNGRRCRRAVLQRRPLQTEGAGLRLQAFVKAEDRGPRSPRRPGAGWDEPPTPAGGRTEVDPPTRTLARTSRPASSGGSINPTDESPGPTYGTCPRSRTLKLHSRADLVRRRTAGNPDSRGRRSQDVGAVRAVRRSPPRHHFFQTLLRAAARPAPHHPSPRPATRSERCRGL